MRYFLAVMRFIVTSIVALLLVLLLAGCTVGPKYVKPTVPTTPTYKEEGPGSFKESDQWQEEQIAGSNQNLKVAEARFREARAAIRFNRASQSPTITTVPSASYVKNSDFSPNFPSKILQSSKGDFVLPFDLSYELDLWGRVRRSVASAREEAQATAADYETAKLSLEAELALDYFELRSADAQKQLLDDTVKAYTDNLQLTLNRFKGGVAPKADVAQAQTQLDTTRVQDTDVTVQRAQFEHAIAILIGKPPAEFSLAVAPLNYQPPRTPIGLPSELLQRRPDIAAAERRVRLAERLLGCRSGSRTDSVRCRAPSRHFRIGTRELRCRCGNLSSDLVDGVPRSRRQRRRLAHSRKRNGTATAGRCVIAGISSTFYESLQRWGGHVSPGHHRADDRTQQRAKRH